MNEIQLANGQLLVAIPMSISEINFAKHRIETYLNNLTNTKPEDWKRKSFLRTEIYKIKQQLKKGISWTTSK